MVIALIGLTKQTLAINKTHRSICTHYYEDIRSYQSRDNVLFALAIHVFDYKPFVYKSSRDKQEIANATKLQRTQ